LFYVLCIELQCMSTRIDEAAADAVRLAASRRFDLAFIPQLVY